MDPTGTQFEEIPARPGPGGLFFALLFAGLGAVSGWLASSEREAEFSGYGWRGFLGFVGGWLLFLGARAIVRMLSGESRRLTHELHKRAAQRGKLLIAIGLAFFAMAVVGPLGDATIDFRGWTKPVYITGGAMLVLQGLVSQWNPTRFIRQQRVARGEGRPGVVRIVRASDTGTTVNEMPQTKIEFELEVGGETHLVSDKIVMERAKLALLIPGSTMNVLVDRVDPNVFHIDWDSWKPPAA